MRRAPSPSWSRRRRFSHQLLEAGRIEVVWTDVEGVAGFSGDDRRCAEGAPKLADLGLQGVGWVGHLAVTPEEPRSAGRR